VAAGIYDLTAPIVVNEAVTLTGNPVNPASVVLNAPTDQNATSGNDREVFHVLSDNVTIQGFTIRGSKDIQIGSSWNSNPGIAVGGDKLMLVNKPDGATEYSFNYWGFAVKGINILDNIIRDNSYGIFLFHSQNVVIEGNEICENTRDANTWSGKGIEIYTSVDMADPTKVSNGTVLPHTNNISINKNKIYNNKLFGIELNHAEAYHGGVGGPFDVDVRITNNEIYNNGGPMDAVGQAFDYARGITSNSNEKNVTVTSNKIYGHTATTGVRFKADCAGIRMPATSEWVIDDNQIYGNTRGIYAYAGASGIEIGSGNNIYGNAQGIVLQNDGIGTIAESITCQNNNVDAWVGDGLVPGDIVYVETNLPSEYGFELTGANQDFAAKGLVNGGPIIDGENGVDTTGLTAVGVTLKATTIKELGYDRVVVQGPTITQTQGTGGTLQFWAYSAEDGKWFNAAVTGWGSGFPIAADYNVTTPVYVFADQAGTYQVTFKLADLDNDSAVLAEKTATITVIEPSPFTFDSSSGTITGYTGDATELIIPDYISVNGQNIEVTAIGRDAFKGNTQLTGVVIPDTVVNIYVNAFQGCTNLENVTIGSKVANISSYAFAGCTELVTVDIPDNVKTLDNNAFNGCTSLATITIGSGISYLKNYLFEGCTSLNNVTIPANVNLLGLDTFKDCDGLTNLVIEGNLVGTKGGAFSGCSNLTNVTIGNNVTVLGNYLFQHLSALGTISIPDGVAEIGFAAFQGTDLTSVTIPNSVTTLGQYVFQDCVSLTSITIGTKLTGIPNSAFSGCVLLQEIVLPDNVSSIGEMAFASWPNSSSDQEPVIRITLGSNVTIAEYIYYNENRNSFKSVYEADGKVAGEYVYSEGSWSRVAADLTAPNLTNVSVSNRILRQL
jgi:parallel beta-helix repeat protein